MENKTGKYFKYAIGEIVLVVIGILIALQINTWNQEKSNQSTLKQFLVEYKEELRLNIKDFKLDIKLIASQKKNNDNLLKNKRLDTIPLDSLEKHLEPSYIKVSYSPTLLKRFENSQITNYGKYDSIFYNLQELYGYLWPEFNIDKNKHNTKVDEIKSYWLYQQNNYEFNFSHGNNTFINDSTQRKKVLINLLMSPKARNLLKVDSRSKEFIKKKMDQLKGFAETNLKEINKLLE